MPSVFDSSSSPSSLVVLVSITSRRNNFLHRCPGTKSSSQLKHNPLGSWIVRQSVGSSPCLLGKVVDCNYIRGPKYLEIDVDIGSSTVANGVLGLVIVVVTTLVIDMAFLVQGNTKEDLPEWLIGAVRLCHLDLSSAIVPKFDSDPPDPSES